MSRNPCRSGSSTSSGTSFDLLSDLPKTTRVPSVRPPPLRTRPGKPPPHIARRLRKYAIGAAWLVPLALIEVSMDAGLTLSYRFLIDNAIVPHDAHALRAILLALAVGLIISAVASTWRDYLASRVVARIAGDIRRAVYDHVQRVSVGFHSDRGSADLLSRFSNDIAALEQSLSAIVSGVLLPALGLVVGAGLLFVVLDWEFALFGSLIWPLVLIGPRLLAPRAALAAERKKETDAALFAKLQQAIDGHRVVKAFGLSNHLRTGFIATLRASARTSARAGFLAALVERSTVVPVYAVQVIAVSVGAVITFRGAITVGLLVAFLTIFWNLGWSLVVLSRAAPVLVAASGSMRRIDELLDEPPDPIELSGGAAPSRVLAPLSHALELSNVSFRYDSGTVALLMVSMQIRAGEYVALVGPSGSGKSTILGLLSRFYDPQGGTITFDGVDIRTADVSSLRAQTATVMQDSFLFDTTLRENIRMGRPEATDAEVEDAAREADIHDTIVALPKGYETRIGDGGIQMSGGQRQRIAIARALVRKPSVMLLDEASSALDPATEATVNETLARACEGRTTISVTHRLVSAVNASRIYVLQACRVVEVGNHAELLARNGVYAALWRKQNDFDISGNGSHAVVSVARLREIPLLAPLESAQLESLSKLFVKERAAAGQIVFRQGDLADLFYVIVRGTVSVTTGATDAEEPPREIARLHDGDPFGEMALLYDSPRSATITAVSDCTFITLTRERFTSMLAGTPRIRAAVEEAAKMRVAALRGTPLSDTLQ